MNFGSNNLEPRILPSVDDLHGLDKEYFRVMFQNRILQYSKSLEKTEPIPMIRPRIGLIPSIGGGMFRNQIMNILPGMVMRRQGRMSCKHEAGTRENWWDNDIDGNDKNQKFDFAFPQILWSPRRRNRKDDALIPLFRESLEKNSTGSIIHGKKYRKTLYLGWRKKKRRGLKKQD